MNTPAIAPLQRDIAFTRADFAAIASFVHIATGIRLTEANEPLVFSRLAKRVRALELTTFADYLAIIRSPSGAEEREAMISALTTNTTRFFREDYHFDTIVADLLPELAERARRGERVRLWSAGCSSGEEPYSLAMSILQALPDAPDLDLRILATDIDRRVLAQAERGLYPAEALGAVPDALRAIGFGPATGASVGIAPQARALVTFRFLNLVEPWPVRGPFDAILCRNVAIYMDDATQAGIWRGFADLLRPGGYLFTGHSERISAEIRPRFDLCGKTTYRLIDGSAPESGGRNAETRGKT
ncbi:chemotaxis protein methyltransferase CheR [Tranquillimonas rosea]|uniref:Chemotaxis protein methyltransferase n=1 Tax=Tranquillimonas rosea TaxID=641238 RepID=A0A1H9VTV5_9RHOB|nr:protein-glutamate O-methyltransferase [Tranquillimonas rosea]SES24797.1 chemotaxis protein methyltransferase CheR [Tranquillimonas rosea]